MLDPRVMQDLLDQRATRSFRSLGDSPSVRGQLLGRRDMAGRPTWLVQDEHGKEHELLPHDWELADESEAPRNA